MSNFQIEGDYRRVNIRDINSVWAQNQIHEIIDLQTGIRFKVRGQANSARHIDYQTVSAEDTRLILQAFGTWSWNGRPIVFRGPRAVWIPSSIHCMPHALPVSDHDHGNQFIVQPANIVGATWGARAGQRGHACIWVHDSHVAVNVNNTAYANRMRQAAVKAHELATNIRNRPIEKWPIDPENIHRLVELGIINSPDFWLKQYSVRWLNELMRNIGRSDKIQQNVNNGITNFEEALEKMVAAGIISTPEYWRNVIQAGTIRFLDNLIINIANRIVL